MELNQQPIPMETDDYEEISPSSKLLPTTKGSTSSIGKQIGSSHRRISAPVHLLELPKERKFAGKAEHVLKALLRAIADTFKHKFRMQTRFFHLNNSKKTP